MPTTSAKARRPGSAAVSPRTHAATQSPGIKLPCCACACSVPPPPSSSSPASAAASAAAAAAAFARCAAGRAASAW
eukprot:4026617-Prymnesium_polylepis.2